MRLGIGSFAYRWSVGRPYYRPEKPMTADDLIDRCIEYDVKALLYCNNMELENYSDEKLQELHDRLEKEGITVEVGSRGTDRDYFIRMLHVSKILGAKVLRIGWDMDRTADAEGLKAQVRNGIETVKSLMPLAHEYGVEVGIENGKGNLVSEVKEIIEGVGDPALGAVVDTCNSTVFITPTEEAVRTLAPYAKSVHIKDYVVTLNPRGDIITGVAMGKGYVDFPKVLRILEENGYQGNCFVELYIDRCETHEETMKKEWALVKESIDYAKNVLNLR